MNPLLSADRVALILKNSAPYCIGHGGRIRERYLGGALLYYTLTFMYRARLAVCVGSGTGLVPRLMRQAQEDAKVKAAQTILIDADTPDVGWVQPEKERLEWARRTFDFTFWRMLLHDGAHRLETVYVRGRKLRPTYIHIDADHTAEGVSRDWDDYSPLLAPGGVITLHDTNQHNTTRHKHCRFAGVHHLVERIRASKNWDICDLYDLGDGCAIVKHRR